ncbi:hypothetical protein ONR57_12705 [Hoyosella sp. YIM 151337]|uniref:hypothetical protein n=1 Tax=Hoyosella sp. YIM 151337 TaxID=2992742 RepID=UPI0022367533|nr:hypothetical protein [Hoyosella sp. YIM 151337]MCW4354161.1 hypothetical protein [Hoyosella sp. YIM 151337]
MPAECNLASGSLPVVDWLVIPEHLLTVAEYVQIAELEPGYSELGKRRVAMSPSPVPGTTTRR